MNAKKTKKQKQKQKKPVTVFIIIIINRTCSFAINNYQLFWTTFGLLFCCAIEKMV